MTEQLDPILKELTDRFCDRRALAPLRYLLQAYPLVMGTTDEWQELWQALRNLRGVGVHHLQPEERALVENAYRLLDRELRAAGRIPTGPAT